MASSPGKRSPRKTGTSRQVGTPKRAAARAAPSRTQPPVLVDPETADAVRRATIKTINVVLSTVGTGSRGIARGTALTAQWLWPRLSALTIAVVGGSWRGLGHALRWVWGQRSTVVRIGHRGLWWGALAILVLVGRALLSADGDPELVELATLWLSAGLSMSVLVLIGAPETRMRVAAFALASGHGSLAALAWIVATGS